MTNFLRKIFFSHPALTGISVFILAGIVGFLLSYREYQLDVLDEEKSVKDLVEILEEKLQSIIKASSSSTKILAYLYQHDGLDDDFDEVGKSIIDNIPILDHIQYLDSGTIVATYPLAGNESIIGYNILEDNETIIAEEAIEAIKRKTLYFAGPLELKQGGKAIIGRQPIFENENFIGFAAVIIDWEKLKKVVFSSDVPSQGFAIDILKENPTTHEINSILETSFEDLSGPMLEKKIIEGNWIIKVQKNKNEAFSQILIPSGFRLITSILLGFLIFNITKQPAKLEKRITETTKELQVSNQRFEYAAQATSEMIWDWDMVSDKVYRSPNFEKHLGYSLEELNSDSNFWFALIHPDEREENLKKVEKFLKSDKTFWEVEVRVKTKQGDYIYVLEKIYLIRDKKGNPVRIIGSTQNITDRKVKEQELKDAHAQLKKAFEELGTSQDKYSKLFDRSPLPIIVYDPSSLKILEVNNAAVEKYQFSYAEFMTMDILDIHPKDEVPKFLDKLDEFKQTQRKDFRKLSKHQKKDGTIFEVDVRPSKIKLNYSSVNMVLISDITEKLRHIHKIEEQIELFKEIAWIQSHVVRAPLARILGLLSLLEVSEEPLPEEIEEYITHINDSANELDGIVKDIGKKLDVIAQNEDKEANFYFGKKS